jgi:hypothetical protein
VLIIAKNYYDIRDIVMIISQNYCNIPTSKHALHFSLLKKGGRLKVSLAKSFNQGDLTRINCQKLLRLG